jgi:aerobic-type carbon monoxide dehydrogenase small subunit (CoxS/CutS family)
MRIFSPLRNPSPTREQARLALSGNLCRCGDYDKILKSAMRAAELTRAQNA